MITRRGFLGSMVAGPVAASFVIGGMPDAMPRTPEPLGDECGLRFDDGASRGVEAAYFANVVLKLVTRHLRGVPLASVGGATACVGDVWGSGTFNQQPWLLLPNIRFVDDSKLVLDRLEVADMAEQYAAYIRSSGIRYVGRLALPNGLQHAVRVENHRLSLRFLTFYEHWTNCMVGRFDVLGSTA